MGCDALQNISKPDEGVYALEFAGAHQRVKHSASFCCFVASGKQIIFSTDGQRSYGVFYRVVIYVKYRVAGIST